MEIFDTRNTPYFRARDECLLCELFHPGDLDREETPECSIVHAVLAPGERTLPHRLMASHEIYLVIAGAGMMHVGEESAPVHPGQAVWVPPGHRQWIENTADTTLVFLAVCQPPWSGADEVIE